MQPDFLVEEEQDKVVEERSRVLGAHSVVPTSSDQDGIVAGKVLHRVAESRARRHTPDLGQLSELAVDNLAVDNDWLEVSKLILWFALLVFASEEVNAVLDHIALFQEEKDNVSVGV